MRVSNNHLLVFCWLTKFFAAIGPASRLLLGNNKMALYLSNGSGLSNLQNLSINTCIHPLLSQPYINLKHLVSAL